MKMIPEIFDLVSRTSDRNQKVQLLRKNGRPGIREILRLVFTPGVEWVDMTIPNWRPDDAPEGLNVTSLDVEYRRLYLWQKIQRSESLSPKKREELLLTLLESMHVQESNLVVNLIQGKFPYDGITEDVVREAFPDLLPEVVSGE